MTNGIIHIKYKTKNMFMILLRLILGILFIPLFLFTFFVISPLFWIVFGEFSAPMDYLIEGYNKL